MNRMMNEKKKDEVILILDLKINFLGLWRHVYSFAFLKVVSTLLYFS